MKSKFQRIALFGKFQSNARAAANATSRAALGYIAGFLQQLNCAVIVEQATAGHMQMTEYPVMDVETIGANCDLGLVVGGDGTMLGIGRRLAQFGVPVIGINQGRLGFITDIPFDNFQAIQATLEVMLSGEYQEDPRSLMQGRVMRKGRCVYEAQAMNDVVVNRGTSSGMVELRVEVDGHFVANQRADGLIIATPTGSTAYSLSAGGPLLHPSIPGWVLVPIAPHTLSNRPIVLSSSSEVAIEIVAGRDASASFDMQTMSHLHHGDRIVVNRSEHQVRFLHPKDWNYFDTLREKLHWNKGVA